MTYRLRIPNGPFRTFILLALLGLPFGPVSHGNAGSAEMQNPAASLLERSREAALPVAKELMQTLEGRLQSAMTAGGPPEAIRVCQEQAGVLTGKVRENKEITYLKRVGVRIRNPENAPDAAEKRALAHFLENGAQEGQFPMEWVDRIALPDGSEQVRYYRAIPMQARCLLCHGPEESMPESVLHALKKRYPEDAARGFGAGELRGLLVVGLDPDKLE
ncbi:MAG: Tll0287-like domain-containing protein [Oceanipulchritudo sp.]